MKNRLEASPTQAILNALLIPMLLSLVMWVVYKLDTGYRLNLYEYGVFPRTIKGLTGIIATPLLHDTRNVYHILENTIALLFFGFLLFYFYKNIAGRVLVFSWIFTQLLVWLAAKESFHVGMSGVIYSLAFFLLTGSIIRKNRQLTGVTFLIIFLYGSIFWGLFPLIPQVSWESHLYGALTGMVFGLIYRKVNASQVPIEKPLEDDPGDDDEDAWWKTGIINDEKKEAKIHYHYTSNQPKDNEPSQPPK